jgi:hypothetical protein
MDPARRSRVTSIDFFAHKHSDDAGQITLTHHVVWAGGVKLASPQNYWEHRFYG